MENRHDIISRINEKYAAMSKGHKAIATYIMEHYDQAAFMTAAKLGAELEISESTVVRFAAGLVQNELIVGICRVLIEGIAAGKILVQRFCGADDIVEG